MRRKLILAAITLVSFLLACSLRRPPVSPPPASAPVPIKKPSLVNKLYISDAQTIEGDDGTTEMTFIVTLRRVGDVNLDGAVDNSDLIAVRTHRGEPLTDANRHYDVTCDGVIDNSDMIAVRVRRTR